MTLYYNYDGLFHISYIIHVFFFYSDNIELAALVVLPALLPDRSKVNTDKVLYIAKVCKLLY